MKKYDKAIIASFIIYILTALLSAFIITNIKEKQNNYYKIEINRAMNDIKTTGDYSLQGKNYTYIKDINKIRIDSSKNDIENFLSQPSKYSTEIRALKDKNNVSNYVRFGYEVKNNSFSTLIICEISLFILEMIALLLFLYIRKKIIIPFSRLNSLPKEMSNGHYNMDVLEERKDYFTEFLSNISRLKDSLATSKKRELHLQKEKKLLLLSISHDIKTPLNTIKLYANALKDNMYSTKDEEKGALNHIIEKTDIIEDYVEDIISASREDILDINIKKEEFYLKDLIDKVYTDYSEKCKRRMTEFTINKYNNRLITGDKERLFEVFENIIENAFKYGDGRKIDISFSEEEYRLLIKIYNTGTPVTENDYNHIFDSFFRGSNAERQSGNGLGLYICREIMIRQGFEIFAEKSDMGMTFVLVI